jgi:hypothetical protein
MFVVGLLLYLGETVFQNAGEETFTLYVKTLTGTVIKVSDCKKNDMLSGFMKKFEEAYTEKISDMDYFSKTSYKLLYLGKSIVKWGKPIEDKSLEDLGIHKESTLHVVFRGRNVVKMIESAQLMVTNEEKEYNITKENEDPATSTCPCSRVCRLCGC